MLASTAGGFPFLVRGSPDPECRTGAAPRHQPTGGRNARIPRVDPRRPWRRPGRPDVGGRRRSLLRGPAGPRVRRAHRPVRTRGGCPGGRRRGRLCGGPRRSREERGRAGADRRLRAGRGRPARGGSEFLRGASRPAGRADRPLDGRPDRRPIRPAVRRLADRDGALRPPDRRVGGGRPAVGTPEIPDVPLDISTLSRDPRVGKDYDSDPLVWHGPFKRTTVEAIDRAIAAIAEGPSLGSLPLMWAHGEGDQLVPLTGSRSGIEHLKGERYVERIYPEARHEIFNEINADEVLAYLIAFIDGTLQAMPLAGS